jgi:hypothetical protein
MGTLEYAMLANSSSPNVSGVNGEKIDVTGYVKIPLTIKDERTNEVRSFTRPILVLSASDRLTSFLAMTSSKRNRKS